MEVSMSNKKIKNILKEIIIEMIKEAREEFCALIQESIEEIGLANAIKEGRKNKLVDENRILNILKG